MVSSSPIDISPHGAARADGPTQARSLSPRPAFDPDYGSPRARPLSGQFGLSSSDASPRLGSPNPNNRPKTPRLKSFSDEEPTDERDTPEDILPVTGMNGLSITLDEAEAEDGAEDVGGTYESISLSGTNGRRIPAAPELARDLSATGSAASQTSPRSSTGVESAPPTGSSAPDTSGRNTPDPSAPSSGDPTADPAAPVASTSTEYEPSPMAPGPRPAEKHKAGRKAVAAIHGGGGLGPKGNKSTALQKVLSKTRPRHLPPKPPEEDKKHLREFAEMMVASAKAERKRGIKQEMLRRAREAMLAGDQPAWEKEVLPNWKIVLREESRSRQLRKMWWQGSMPPRHRGRLWHQCIGNAGAVSRAALPKSVAMARSLSSSTPTRFPEAVSAAIDADILLTLPSLKLFQPGRPMHADLRDVLVAYSVFWRQEPFYPTGSAWLAALLLINMSPAEAFVALVNIVRKSCLSYFYNSRPDEVAAFYRIFDTLLSDTMPKMYRNFSERGIRPAEYLEPWISTCYVRYLPFELATHVMDVFVLEGDSFLFRLALAMLSSMEARLLTPDGDALRTIFRGEDKGARTVVARETGRPLEDVGRDEAYEEMGCDEETTFRHLQEQTWNEALWDRLVARELPD